MIKNISSTSALQDLITLGRVVCFLEAAIILPFHLKQCPG